MIINKEAMLYRYHELLHAGHSHDQAISELAKETGHLYETVEDAVAEEVGA